MAKEMPKAYEPGKYEDNIYEEWENSGFFDPDKLAVPKKAPSYSIIMPPPNVTGNLHMGHAAMLAIEDILIRYRRMKGERALWLPGTDHAAIATQAKVEKILKAEGTDRHKLGRQKFLERLERFAQDSHDTIVSQIKKMGSSCDWSREAYTLDKTRTKAVRSVFKMMYDDGLIYRGLRIVNWCPRCHSTLSDDEVEYAERKDPLYWLKYGPFILATTRPETKLGDTAVAVYPGDERYRHMVGKKYMIPGVLGEFEITVVADKAVDPEFGSGAIKVTPAHDFTDYEIAARNKIALKQIINEDGRMMPNCGKYAGLTTAEARAAIVADMEKMGLIDHVDENYVHNIAVCYRCGEQIEPLPSEQWFIDVNKKITRNAQRKTGGKIDWSGKSIKDIALEVVKTGKVRIIPERFEKNYYHWMENLRDWCISRQIWFGHRVPVWYRRNAECGMRNAECRTMKARRFIDLNFRDRNVFEAIKKGKKTVEIRALNPEEKDRYFGDLKTGDLLVLNYIENGKIKESLKTEIKNAAKFQTVDRLLEKYEIDRIWPGGKKDELIKFYESIPDYSEKIKENGLIAIELGPVRAANGGKTYLAIVRHGQTDWNKNGIMQGQKDVPLNGKGQADAAKLAKKIEHEMFDVVITSPLKRTSETASLLNTFGVELIEDERLKERSYGKFEGMKTAEVLRDHPEIKTFEVNGLPYWIGVPTAETYEQVKVRVEDFLADIRKKYAGKRVLTVSHGDTLDMFYAVLNDLPNEKAYGRFSLNMRLEKYELDADGAEEVYVGVEPPAGDGWKQDEDTLDTWFSSGLWTFSTLARTPDEIRLEKGRLVIDSVDFKSFHPTAVLETGYDILFFWVARMIIMTTYAVGDIPFRDVYLHGLVRDEQGRKMSKSLGNTIDPLVMCGRFGTDATRLSLVIGTSPGSDMNLSEAKIAGYKNFVNKLWNVARYIMQTTNSKQQTTEIDYDNLTLSDRWILGKLDALIREVTEDLENYRLSAAGERLRVFTWDELADWYLEAAKFENSEEKKPVLAHILNSALRLWHPFIPFVTEAIWKEAGEKDALMISKWPKTARSSASAKEAGPLNDFDIIKNIITAIRNARSENKVEPARKVKAVIYAGKKTELVKSQETLINNLRTGLAELTVKEKGEKIPDAIYCAAAGTEIYLLGAVDADKEEARLNKEIAKLQNLITNQEKKLANKEFTDKAPAVVVEKEKEKLAAYREELKKLRK